MKDEKRAVMNEHQSLLQRSRAFSVRIIRLYARLPKRPIEQCIGRQLLRSGTSVGAHLHEGKRSRSTAEIISKTEGALQELEESVYWMELLCETAIFPRSRLQPLLQEADELTAILVSGVRRLKQGKSSRRLAN
jgi:four helix bundle protein